MRQSIQGDQRYEKELFPASPAARRACAALCVRRKRSRCRKTLTESLLSAISEEDFAAAAELLDSESGLAETTIRSYIYALEAETDCDFSNGARVVGYTAYEDYTDESSPEEQRTLHKLRADIKVGTMPFTLMVITVAEDTGVSVYNFAFELKN